MPGHKKASCFPWVLWSRLLTGLYASSPLSSTDMEGRPQTSFIALCNSIVSHGAPIGGFGSIATTHTHTNICTQTAPMIFRHMFALVVHAVWLSRMFIFMLRPKQMQVTNMPDDCHIYHGKTPNTPT